MGKEARGCRRVAKYLQDDSEASDDEDSNLRVKVASRVNRSEKFSRPKACLDTGAMETCVTSVDELRKVAHDISDPHWKPKFRLESANGGEMKIIAKGAIDKVLTEAYVVKSLTQSLISPKNLSQKGYWLIGPPENVSAKIGMIVTDGSGKIYMTCDRNYETELSKRGSYNISVELPDLSQALDQISKSMFSVKTTSKVSPKVSSPSNGESAFSKKKKPPAAAPPEPEFGHRYDEEKYIRAGRVYGVPVEWSVARLVKFVHDTYHVSKADLIWMSEHIRGFPVTADQIRKHLVECQCCIAANMRRRKVSNKNFRAPEDIGVVENVPLKKEKPDIKPESTPKDLATTDLSKLDPRRLVEGRYVSTDLVGPILNAYVMPFCDFATGYGYMYSCGKKGKAECPDGARTAASHFKRLKSPIGTLCADSEQVFKSDDMARVAEEKDFEISLSPPYQHEYNACEVFVKVIKNRAVAMQEGAPHVTEYLWPGL